MSTKLRVDGAWVDCASTVAGVLSDTLALPLVAWEGGPDYYTIEQSGSKMAKAEAAGMADPSFFPIATWLIGAEHAQDLLDVGINVLIGPDLISRGHGPHSDATDLGMIVFPLWEDRVANPPGADPLCVAWHSTDEPELYMTRAQFESNIIAPLEALADGRFIHTNHAQVILDTHWWAGEATQAFENSDLLSVDHYFYTAQNVRENTTTLPADTGWPLGTSEATAKNSAAYGFLIDRMRHWGGDGKPYWGYIETQMPYLTNANNARSIITYAQIRGAVWASIVHEARGIIYFQQNGYYSGTGSDVSPPTVDPNTGAAPNTFVDSLRPGGDAARISYVAALNAEITALAPVLNTQSYVWDCEAAGIDTMLKAHEGHAYIFATVGLGGATGSKTFTLPPGVTGSTVTVLNESRTVPVSGGQFTDTFSNEYSQHNYKVAI